MITTCGIFIINSDNNILVVKATNSNNWSIPKGVIDKKETTFDCVIRECFEETNVDLRRLINAFEFSSFGTDTCKYYKQSVVKKQLYAYCFKFNNNKLNILNLKCNSFIGNTNILEVDKIEWKSIDWCLKNLHYTQIDCLKIFLNNIKN